MEKNCFSLTELESGMYIEQLTDPDSTAYNLNAIYYIQGASREAVDAALREIFHAHEAFRSSYGYQDGVPVRILTESVPEVEWRAATDMQTAQMDALKNKAPYDLSAGIPVRAHGYMLQTGGILVHLGIHHIAFDGTSVELFARELLSRLKGEVSGEDKADLTDIEKLDRRAEIEKGLSYYRDVFRDGVPVNDMPVCFARPKRIPAPDRVQSLLFDAVQLRLIADTAKETGTTVFQLLFGAVSMVLGRYCGSEDVVLGVPANTRDTSSKDVIGMFANTAPVRVRPVGRKTLKEYLTETAAGIKAATRTSWLPFSEVVREFAGERDTSRHPVFDVSVNYLHQPYEVSGGGIAIEGWFPDEHQHIKRDMTITIHRSAKEMTLALQYSGQLYTDALIGRFLEQLKATIHAICSDPGATLAQLTALPEKQREELEALSIEAAAQIPDELLHLVFEKVAAQNPYKTALIASDRTMTFSQLNREANRIAWNLIERGIVPGDRVLLLLPRQSFYFSAMFGVLKAGAAFIPCDMGYPPERISRIIDDSGAAAIITTGAGLSGYDKERVFDIRTLLSGTRDENPDLPLTGDSLAYMIYTSGSTGVPKGVMLAHRGICNYLLPHPANLHYDILSREVHAVLSVTTLSFDMSFKETTGALCNGKTLVFADETQINDPWALADLVLRTGVDCFNATPSRLMQYLECEPFSRALAGCFLVMCGGEAYPMALRDRLKEILRPEAHIINTYGPTEITVSCNGAELNGADHISVGRPLLNVREYIADKWGQLAPRGVAGELYIGGPGVARGYRNLEKETAKSFVNFMGGRFYRSGDLARWDEEGNVQILGRMDDQVKLRGLRIEPGEIEKVLESFPGIREAVVMVRSLGSSEYLAAYFTADSVINPEELRDYASGRLTPYMVPSAFAALDAIPTTKNGKVDRKALPEPEWKQEELIPPQNERQKIIFDCVAEMLGHRAFGITTDLYSAGISSLGAVGLNVKLSKAFDLVLTLRDIRDNPTVQQLDVFLSGQTKREEYALQADYPLSRTQTGILAEALAYPDTTIYNIPKLWKLSDLVDVKRLKQAVETAVKAHPYLNAEIFAAEDGSFRVRRTDDAAPLVELIETPALSDPLVTPFGMTDGRLYRIRIYVTDDGNYLFMDFHHIIFDGASGDVLLQDIETAYSGGEVQRETYTGFEAALDEEKLRASGRYSRAEEWYDNLLAGVDRDMLPDGDQEGREAAAARLTRDTELDGAEVTAFCSARGFTENAFFNAVFAFVLSRFSGKDDVVYTTIYNGRGDSRLARAVTMLVKTFPVAIPAAPDREIAPFVSALSDQLVGSMSNDICSFTEIAGKHGISADVMFIYQGEVSDFDSIGGERAARIPLAPGEARAAIAIQVFRHEGRYRFDCDYRNDLYSEDYMRLFTECMEQAAGEFLRREKLGDISLLTPETEAGLDGFNATEQPDPVEDIVSMFRAVAQKFPDRQAVVYKERAYTYREVDDISERIAVFLRAHGAGRGSVASILIPRCEYMTIAALGVLKSGAAYQPLDPSYPGERLTFMMKDADCRVLIADEALTPLVPEYDGPVLLTKDIPFLPAGGRIEDHPSPEDLFVLLYTSGTTGVPKGVMLEHRNLCNLCYLSHAFYRIDEHSRSASYAGFGFDAVLLDTYPVLTRGGCVYIMEEEIRLDLVAMEAWFNRHAITHAVMTTQVARQFYTAAKIPSLKYITAGGEKLVPMQPIVDGPILLNGYGPSECTVECSMFPVDRLYRRIPVGKALRNVKLYVVDANMHRLPPLVPGELLIAGRGVGRGYLNRPELTEKAFIPNPFSDSPDYSRVYRTGDIVRFLPDGNLDFIGRNDGQVKVRGFRIELTEVEAVLREFPGITDATVQAFEDEATGEKYIAAYVVSENEVDVEALNSFIRSQKPAYMVPAATMQIDAIPLTPNQKVNKKALPRPERRGRKPGEGAATAAPLNVLEKEIRDMAAEIVGTEEFGILELFSSLGLTSISAIRLATQIYRRYDVQINPRELLADGSVQSVENAVLKKLLARDAAQDAGADKEPAAEKSTGEQKAFSCPLSFTQQGVYTECQTKPDSVQYNIPFLVRMPEGIGEEQLKAAVGSVLEAHSYLFCRFVSNEDNEVVQEPIPDFTLDIPMLEMTEEELEKYKAQFVRPFDLAKGPALRFEIVRTDTLNLLMDIHHLIADGSSLDLFFSQLCRALDGKEIEKEQYTYYDYAAEEKITPEAEAFFAGRMAQMEDATRLIPDVYGEDLPHTEKSTSVHTDFAAVKAFAHRQGLTPAAVYLAATYITYGRYVCEDTVAIATISNGRSNLKISGTMGMFVNTLPLVTRLDHSEKTADYLRHVAQDFSDTIAHENYPFARIAGKYDFHPAASYTYQIGVIGQYRSKYGEIRTESLELDIAKLPVGIYIVGTEDDARIEVHYDSALYSASMMKGLAESVENVVRGLLTCETLSQISLTGAPQWKILDSYNAAWDLAYEQTDTIVTVFRRNAAQQPDKTAAVYRDKSYTYRELDELTDILAGRLYRRAYEVTGKTDLAEEVVSILIPRDENVFILPMAAVKAGLAYEPLDPGYPGERLNFMVKDAGACLLLAEESLLDLVDEYDGAVLTVRELYEMEYETEEEQILPAGPRPEDLFIMLYTSGSTGMPKGCQIEHRNMVSYAHGVRNDFYTREDRIAAYASFGFDVNMSDVFCTLLNGGTVYLIPEEIRMDLKALAAYFDEAGITALLLTTQVGVQFLQNYPQLKTLRMLVMGGEKLPAVDPSKLSYTIVNGYGPTENCCGVSLFPIRVWEPNIPIGKPMATIHGYVLDKTGHRLPAGAAGEYCLSGPQVSRGYLNRPDKTQEAYEPCPFNEFRMYHTGDIVRYRQNGDVEFVGRKDGQVKIRGFRIETKEVEAVIRSFAGIKDVTVQAYDYEGGGKYLAAFVAGGAPVDLDELRSYIKEQKPAYMVPAAIMQIDEIPLTVNQKVDKKALPKPELQKAAYVAPEGRTEEDFCAIFGSILGIEKVSAEDDFFEAGGSSILAMKVVIAAGKAGYSIVYNDVFSYTTPRALARFAGGEVSPAEAEASAGGAAGDQEAAPPQSKEAAALPEIDRDGYDYSRIHDLLARNTMDAFRNGPRLSISDVLLLGGTGYLGSHVLHELILHSDNRIYCLVRAGRGESGRQRLEKTFTGYFGEEFAKLPDDRITVIEGDATDPAVLAGFTAPSPDMTAINCAANVRHFARGGEIERVNVNTVRNLTAWCEANDARLVHISTGSVAGSRTGGMPPEHYRFDEHRLYAGQVTENNQYAHSKFMAERHIYEEMLRSGLRAKVLRMGNLAPREADGEFQANYRTNNYMNMFRAYQTLGMVPYDAMEGIVEFSPIDVTAKAVLALSTTPDACVCFMPLNSHRPRLGDVILELNALGYPVRGVENEEFAQAFREALSDEGKSEAVSCLMAYQNSDKNIRAVGLESSDNTLTTGVLRRLGLVWPETGSAYIRRFLKKLEEKGFFRGNDK